MTDTNSITSTVLAMTLQDALSALLKLHSLDLDADQLREGLPAAGEDLPEDLLERTVKRIGYRLVWQDRPAIEALNFPCCVLLQGGGYAIALAGNSETYTLMDPRRFDASIELSRENFQAVFAGRSFEVLPAVETLLIRHSSGPTHTHWFWGRLFLQKRSLFNVIGASLFANILAVVTSLFALQVYDRVIPAQSEATLWVLASGVGLAIFFEAVLRISRARLVDHVGKEAEIEITSELFERVISMKIDKRPASPGAIVYMVREFSAVKEFFTNVAVGVVADLPFAVIFLLLIYGIAGHVVWIILAGAILIVLPNIALQSRMSKLSQEAQGGMSSASRLLTEASYGLEALRTTRSEPMFQKQWEEIIALNAIKTTEQRSLRAFLTYWAMAIQQATYVFAVIACVYMVFSGGLSTGAIIAIGILTTRTLSPISQLSQALSSWQNMRTALTSLETVVNSQQERTGDRSYLRRPKLSGNINFQRLRYAHQGAKHMSLDIENLEIPAGQRLAILGANGSGKSTFLRLAAGIYQPTEGEVLIGNLDIRQVDPTDLRRNIGYLPQETKMFRGTLRDNLSSGRLGYTDDQLLESLAFGGLGDFVRRHPDGLDLQISDGGEGLSVGQRQSIGLARLFLQDPSIVILDEPTSALDSNLENTLVPRIGKWIGERTCIIATHRPLILSEMTHVAVLQQGRVVLAGKRDDVLRKIMTPVAQTTKVDVS